jgi:hypothetical protein
MAKLNLARMERSFHKIDCGLTELSLELKRCKASAEHVAPMEAALADLRKKYAPAATPAPEAPAVKPEKSRAASKA